MYIRGLVALTALIGSFVRIEFARDAKKRNKRVVEKSL